MAVYVNNLTVNAGVDFVQTFIIEDIDTNGPLDLTRYEIKAQMRKHAGAVGVTTFNAIIPNPETGKIQLWLSTTSTASLKPGRYVYDVVVTDTTDFMSKVLEGMVLVREGVTR